jgi:hypothetical protein
MVPIYSPGDASGCSLMIRLRPLSRKKPILIAILVIASFLSFVGKKIFDYSAPPTKEKDCDFVFPANEDQTKPTSIAAPPLERSLPFEQLGGLPMMRAV